MDPNQTSEFFTSLLTQNIWPKLLLSAAILVGLVLLRRAAMRLLDSRPMEPAVRYRAAKTIGYLFYLLLFLTIGPVWLEGAQGFVTFFGLLAAGIAVALREPIANLAGWFYILWRKPFILGDRVEVEGVTGDVADISPFVFSLMEFGDPTRQMRQTTGRLVHVPNSFVFGRRVANASQTWAFIWHEIPVVLTFESDWRRAKAAFLQIARQHVGRFVAEAEADLHKATTQILAVADTLAPIVFTRAVGHGVELSVRYVTPVPQLRRIEQAIWEDILTLCAGDPAIRLAYPTTRSFSTMLETVTGSEVPFARPSQAGDGPASPAAEIN